MKRLEMKNKTLWLLLILAGLIINSCSKKSNPVPYSSIDFTIYLNDPSYTKLNVVGNWVYVTGGINGIIIYRASGAEFTVLDRTCTYDPNNPKSYVKINTTNIIAVDSICGSQFSIINGAVNKAPATLPLKTYSYTYDPTGNSLHVYN